MSENKKNIGIVEGKTRINLLLSEELSGRLEVCAKRYGVSRNQLAVILIGQGVASIEQAFRLSSSVVDMKDLSDVISEKL